MYEVRVDRPPPSSPSLLFLSSPLGQPPPNPKLRNISYRHHVLWNTAPSRPATITILPSAPSIALSTQSVPTPPPSRIQNSTPVVRDTKQGRGTVPPIDDIRATLRFRCRRNGWMRRQSTSRTVTVLEVRGTTSASDPSPSLYMSEVDHI